MASRTFTFTALGLLLHKIEFVVSQSQCVQWNVDPRCPPDDRRPLQEQEDFECLINNRKDDTNTNLRGPQCSHEDMDNDVESALKDGSMRRRSRELSFAGTTNPVTFNIKLHWRPGHCWQREWEERFWCLQCPGSTCDDWDHLWINECNQHDSRQRFEWVQSGIDPTSNQNTGLLKIAGQDLCVEQVAADKFRLRPCDESSDDQQLVGCHISNPFQIRPFHVDHTTDCLTQDHHPKPCEEMTSEPCCVAQKHRTSHWEVHKPSEALVTLRGHGHGHSLAGHHASSSEKGHWLAHGTACCANNVN